MALCPKVPLAVIYLIFKNKLLKNKVFLGKAVAILVSEELDQGSHALVFDAGELANGVYAYQLVAGDPSTGLSRAESRGSGQHYRKVKKMLLM